MSWVKALLTSPKLLALITTLLIAYGTYMAAVVHRVPHGRLPYGVLIAAGFGFSWLGWYIAERGSDGLERGVGFGLLYMMLSAGVLLIIGLP